MTDIQPDTDIDAPKRIKALEFIRRDEQGVLLAGMWRGRRYEFRIPVDDQTDWLIAELRDNEVWVDIP